MNTLNDAQRDIVTDNHKLIYWYAQKRRLNLTDYYDLLGIVLCESALYYSKERGSFSNYFKMRADTAVNREIKKSYNKKNYHLETSLDLLDTVYLTEPEDKRTDPYEEVRLNEILSGKYGTVLSLVYYGYTQNYIANKLGITQSEVSRILKRVGEIYND